ncbi:VPEID-CTERM sorting domain-containing protein [Gemmobacter fulvus]|uniref:VPEID-CTERM sorting domain-containing protein n=1 Tax=Gemmobacter fulvus TaxID=2840474 RepID=A0A975S0T0_9RHOB|nr:VPEID-CTERM sorting domain-containing protein [Gemmobacter fulvus]MBT9245569.1 VPEID-CTERM sorting domain-containing protein [Gemmobacter fulvus]QWK89571.1 VPEID-CTERM sorting domain-containing protein [Gemmobacter fulvus]
MTQFLKSLAAGATVAVVSAGSAAAQTYGSGCSIFTPWRCFGGGGSGGGTPTPTPTSVPEIDASAGLLAIAAVAVVMLFVWERRRRAA